MAKSFHLTLLTPDATLFDGDVQSVSLPTINGEIGVLADHEALVTDISPGDLNIVANNQDKLFSCGGGFAKIANNVAQVFTKTAEAADSIDEKRAIEAKRQAEDLMHQKTDEVSLADATSLLERNIARLKTIERKKRRSHR